MSLPTKQKLHGWPSKLASTSSCRILTASRCCVQLVREGKVSEAAVDKAVARNLRLKFLLGLFENPYVDPDRAVKVTNSREHRELAAEAARRSIVLLKNENNLLPLDRTRSSRLLSLDQTPTGYIWAATATIPAWHQRAAGNHR